MIEIDKTNTAVHDGINKWSMLIKSTNTRFIINLDLSVSKKSYKVIAISEVGGDDKDCSVGGV
jgi:hypothetical protein